MPGWWNGRHNGLKIRCSGEREGSSPSLGTLNGIVELWRYDHRNPFIRTLPSCEYQCTDAGRNGPVAQLVEQAAHNRSVGGSSPSRPTVHS